MKKKIKPKTPTEKIDVITEQEINNIITKRGLDRVRKIINRIAEKEKRIRKLTTKIKEAQQELDNIKNKK